jgi:hypothetical protein
MLQVKNRINVSTILIRNPKEIISSRFLAVDGRIVLNWLITRSIGRIVRNSNETWGSLKDGNFLYQLSEYWRFKKGSAAWSEGIQTMI